MNILLDKLPESVTVGDVSYKVNTDYRTFILFESLMQGSEHSDDEKLSIALGLFYGSNIPCDLTAAVNAMLDFYSCNADKSNKNKAAENGDRMIYSYEHDAEAIFAAFREYYNIDLSTANIHWFTFKAMFNNLPHECEFMRAVMYRTIKIDEKLPAAEKKRLKKLKKFYALPDNRTAEEKERDFANDFAAMF